ncbi:glycosyltransferase family 2 protein [Coleofasciculus chthonoplastes]|uniref:glycosyltransferase family 2 protein n=1 Tax=Coleofasciculus chthonoplastes TaxID=64178 RepID=UPI0033024545
MNPTVTIAIPTYNEEKHIGKVIRCFLNSSYPEIIEIIIADGRSNDNTRQIVEGLIFEDSRIKLLDNRLRIQSAALQLMSQVSKGDIFLRVDAHCEYAPDYVERCVEALQYSGSLNVGGAQRFLAKNPFQLAVALASRSPLGSGKAKYRNPNYTGYADTVFLGCFWLKALLEVGGYYLTRKEDTELNLRLLDKNTQAIYICSSIKVWYFPRSNWKALWNQYVKYGRGCCLINRRYPNKLPKRSNLPFHCLVINLLLFIVNWASFRNLSYIVSLDAMIVILCIIEAIQINVKFYDSCKDEFWRGENSQFPSFLKRCSLCWVVLTTIPIAHAWGYTQQLFRIHILKIDENYFLESGYELEKTP